MKTFARPSREDAWDLTRNEKSAMLFLMNTVSELAEAKDKLAYRISKVDGGTETIDRLVTDSMELLERVRETIPERQRISLVNTAKDYQIRLIPKFTPSTHNVVVMKEDFRQLVDAAQIKCRECVDDYKECRKCKLFKLLTVILPLEAYDVTSLCPYNLAEWAN